ncbi:hypothetical protein Tco_0672663 [Tanacetum coccineum]
MEHNVLKLGKQSQFLKEKGNEAKVNNDIDENETIKIELEHSVAKLLVENELLHNEKDALGTSLYVKAPFLNVQMTSVHISSGLVLHQMASAENNTSGPVPQCSNDVCSHQFRPLKFKAGSKSCSLSKQDSYITTRVGITIPPSHSNAEDNSKKRLGINPMIQPEPEDIPKDNPKLEIAVLSSQAVNKSPTQYPCDIFQNIRVILLVFTMKMEILLESTSNKLSVAFKMRHSMRMLAKDTRSQDGKDDEDNDKGSKSRSQSMKEQAYN